MKKLLFGIFAHPDDEAFGPGIFLHDRAANGTDVHLILVTDGECGVNSGYEDLGATRLAEWHESARRIGSSSNLALHYPDSKLCNDMYLAIARKVKNRIINTAKKYDEPVAIELLTFEERGVTGHLDHIAVSFIASFVYEKLKAKPPENAKIDAIRYYCLSKNMVENCNCDWIYMPSGRSDEEIDEHYSYLERRELKRYLMDAHHSQKNDMKYLLSLGEGNELKDKACYCDHFIIRR